jgi:hypothetical protein
MYWRSNCSLLASRQWLFVYCQRCESSLVMADKRLLFPVRFMTVLFPAVEDHWLN